MTNSVWFNMEIEARMKDLAEEHFNECYGEWDDYETKEIAEEIEVDGAAYFVSGSVTARQTHYRAEDYYCPEESEFELEAKIWEVEELEAA